ncbi:hypothetical protein FHG87_021301 [Trinorchestia longiramus]|nr:hypothetical protein FHG87_021301 [Trinorchestia longiramus]
MSDESALIASLLKKGKTPAQLFKMLKPLVSRSGVYKVIKRFKYTGSHMPKARRTPPRPPEVQRGKVGGGVGAAEEVAGGLVCGATGKTCGDLESCKGVTEMSESERNKLVFDCWKCMMDEEVKMADVNTKMEEEIERLKAKAVSLKRELEMKEKDARSKRKVNGDVNDGARHIHVMKAESVLIKTGCFLEDGVHLSQEGETKLSQRFIRWIKDTHLLMEGRMD